jgi:hypothetical protein
MEDEEAAGGAAGADEPLPEDNSELVFSKHGSKATKSLKFEKKISDIHKVHLCEALKVSPVLLLFRNFLFQK